MKEHPITIGIDDATFELKSNSKKTQLIGVVCQGTRMVSVKKTEIEIDGTDATEKLIDLVRQNKEHVQFILTHTITFGGFNLINLSRIYAELEKPIIAINEREVDIEAVVKTACMNAIGRFAPSFMPISIKTIILNRSTRNSLLIKYSRKIILQKIIF